MSSIEQELEVRNVHDRIEADAPRALAASRRAFVAGAAGAAFAALTLGREQRAHADDEENLAASPPEGFQPFRAPGRVVKVSKPGSLQENKLYPKMDDAKAMLTRALAEFTGKGELGAALALFVHPKDKVVVKLNGIALKNCSTNKELVLPLLEGLIASGVPAESITVLEQYNGFLDGTRVNAQNVPRGVKVAIHGNGNATMKPRVIPRSGAKPGGEGRNVSTKFVRVLTESTAVINVALVKDHSICGYTGAMKNMTHGTIINPQDFHVHGATPQIATLYAQDIVRSRVRLNIADAFKVMYDGGPLYKKPNAVVPYEAVMVSTDPVAIDVIGWEIVEQFRKDNNLASLTKAGRPPSYLDEAAGLGLGIRDRGKIQLKEVSA